MAISQRHQAQLLLLSVAAVWGGAFIAQRVAMTAMGPHTFNAIRFAIGCLILAPLLYRRREFANRHTIVYGAALGLLLFLGSATQQIGMQYTTAGKGGFITSLYIVLVPLLSRALFKHSVSRNAWLGAFLCVPGLYLLAVQEDLSLGVGDTWVLLCAFVFALHIAAAGNFLAKADPLILAGVQYIVAVLCSAPLAVLTEPINTALIASVWPTYLYAGVLSIGYGYTVQLLAQSQAGTTEAGVILGLESVFAAISGALFLDESMTSLQIIGCILVLFGTTLAQVQSAPVQER